MVHQRNFDGKAQHLQIRSDGQRLKGWRYCKAAFHPNGKIKPNVVLVSGVEEKHTEGRYFLNFNNQWIDVGENALEAQRKRLLRLNQIEYERLSGTSLPASPAGHPSVVEFSGRKVIKDEVEVYLADLELTRRPARTVQSKRKYLGDFVGLIGKKFADEYRREDVLKYKNNLQDDGFEPKRFDRADSETGGRAKERRWVTPKIRRSKPHAYPAKASRVHRPVASDGTTVREPPTGRG